MRRLTYSSTDPDPPYLKQEIEDQYRIIDCLTDDNSFSGAVMYVRRSESCGREVIKYSTQLGKRYKELNSIGKVREHYVVHARHRGLMGHRLEKMLAVPAKGEPEREEVRSAYLSHD